MNRVRSRGFTLTELLATLAVTAITIQLGLPALQKLSESSQRRSNLSILQVQLNLARSTAVTRGKNTILCPTDDGNTCAPDWNSGFMVFVDKNSSNEYEAEIDQIVSTMNLENGWNTVWRAFGSTSAITFHPSGFLIGQNGTLEICPPVAGDAIGVLVLGRSGRSRIASRDFSDSRCGGS